MGKLNEIVADNFTRYAGNVILDRAICDVRDMLKPSARMLLYSQKHITKSEADKPFKKSALVVGDTLGHYYTHGDVSCYDTFMRMAKPYAMRYPLEVCQGNSGTIIKTGDHASMRYTELRPSPLTAKLFEDIDKETVENWSLSFNEEDKYPSILPSKGFFNIVNGTTGIAVGMSSSIPQFNINEINKALIDLLNNPKAQLDIMPDFATGAILLNASEVRKSLEDGWGPACKLRSVINYDKTENALKVVELPYGVYTDTVTAQIKKLVDEDPKCGIAGINDGSGKKPDYWIMLEKGADPSEVLRLLYKETSLQTHYTINLTVLVDGGRTPKVLGIRDILLEHLAHEKIMYRRAFEYDLRKLKYRAHILDGYLIVLASIDEVVALIKGAASTSDAKKKLCETFLLDMDQAEAVLKLTLARLTHLEIEKIKEEKEQVAAEIARIERILSDEKLLNAEIENGLRDVMNKYGDARRTQILDIEGDAQDTVEVKQLSVSLTNRGNLYLEEYSSLYEETTQKKTKALKMQKGEYITATCLATNKQYVLLFNENGTYCGYPLMRAPLNTLINVGEKLGITIKSIMPYSLVKSHLAIVTAKGLVKITNISEYNPQTRGVVKAITLADDDILAGAVAVSQSDNLAVMNSSGVLLITPVKDIKPTGRVSKGVLIGKLSKDEVMVAAHLMPATNRIIFASSDGYVKIVEEDFAISARTAKGTKYVTSPVDFIPLTDEIKQITVNTATTSKVVPVADIAVCGRATRGTKPVKMTAKDSLKSLAVKN